jgi:hypothetical protein
MGGQMMASWVACSCSGGGSGKCWAERRCRCWARAAVAEGVHNVASGLWCCCSCGWMQHARHAVGCSTRGMRLDAARAACGWMQHARHAVGCSTRGMWAMQAAEEVARRPAGAICLQMMQAGGASAAGAQGSAGDGPVPAWWPSQLWACVAACAACQQHAPCHATAVGST